MEGLYLTSKEINTLIKYLTFATPKQQLDIKHTSRKSKLTKSEYKRLKSYIFKYKMYMNSCSINVDSRLNKLTRTSPTCTGKQSKHV